MEASCPICGTVLDREDGECARCRDLFTGASPIREWVRCRTADLEAAGRGSRQLGPWLERKVVGLMIQVATVVQEALESGRLHGSLRPDSILVDAREQPHVLDFGRALPPGDPETVCVWQGEGTWACYAAPEILRGDPGSAFSDVFGLGCVLYELLGGVPPFQGSTAAEAVEQVQNGTLPSVRALNPGIDPELERIVMRATGPDPQNRFPGAGDFAESLENWLVVRSLKLHAAGLTRSGSGPSAVLVTGLTLIVGMALASGLFWWKLARRANSSSAAQVSETSEPVFTGRVSVENQGEGTAPEIPPTPILSDSGAEDATPDPEAMARWALQAASRSWLSSSEIERAGRWAGAAYQAAPDSTLAQLAALVWSRRPIPPGGEPVAGPPLAVDLRSGTDWENEGHGWIRSNRWPEAVLAYSRALAGPDQQGLWTSRSGQIRLFRAQAYRHLGLWREAGLDNCWARGIPARALETPVQLVDLSAWYNARLEPNWHGDRPGNDLAALPRGVVQLGAVPFDVRGVIQLHAGSGPPMKWPASIDNLTVGVPCHRLHLLHAATHCKTDPSGTEVGRVVGVYGSGSRAEMPVVLGEHLQDWWAISQPLRPGGDAVVAWVGVNAVSRPLGERIGLYRTSWQSPFPGEKLETLEFKSGQHGPGWFIVAVTID